MKPHHSLILNLIFLAAGVVFLLLEKIYPERKIHYFKEFRLDIMAFVLLCLCGPLVSAPLTTFYQKYPLPSLDLHWSLKILGATLLTDFLNYWVHYWMHRSDFYWKSHVHHHRIQNLYWFSGLRASFGHYLSFILTRVTVGVLIFQLSSLELLAYFSIGIVTNFFQHTNAKIGEGWPEWILVSPRMHRLHHASHGKRLKNIGTIFSFWDKMFGTFEDPEKFGKDYELGIKSAEGNKIKEFIGI